MKFTAEELRPVALLEGLPENQIAWFAEHGERVLVPTGQHMFERGDPADFIWITVRGSIDGYEAVDGQWLRVATTGTGHATGMLPYSRMTHYPRYTVATEDSEVLRIEKRDVPEMLAASPEIGQRLVAAMSDRVRGDVRLEQQHERLAALGRLSAGLAHELNNPAAAAHRAAARLAEEISGLGDLMMGLAQHRVDETHIRAVNALRSLSRERPPADLSALAASEREERIGTWLEEHDLPSAWELAATFADAGLTLEDLDDFSAKVPRGFLANALAWVSCDIGVQRIVGEIMSSVGRISELVASVKIHSHMDRSPEHKPTDVREGLDNTLTLLSHKLKEKNIRIVRDYADDLPPVQANAGELNQVWTNLVDNAIDAMDEDGEMRIEARARDGSLDVNIVDNGHGVSEDIRDRIFEPFFTTKGVGQGTGLGLDIAMRIVQTHLGSITVESRPGRTGVQVRLPLDP
jgi:signal transduction histidine kinase